MLDNERGQIPRSNSGLLGCHQRNVGGPIPMITIAGTLHYEHGGIHLGDRSGAGGRHQCLSYCLFDRVGE
jgi:hypothetical protein